MINLFDTGGDDCRRQWPRQLMILPARLIGVTSEWAVRIRDLSPGGARIEAANLPEIGTDVLLKRGNEEVFGCIAWISGNHAGIEFEMPLEDEALDALQNAAENTRFAPVTDTRRPGFGRKTAHHPRWSDGTGWIDG